LRTTARGRDQACWLFQKEVPRDRRERRSGPERWVEKWEIQREQKRVEEQKARRKKAATRSPTSPTWESGGKIAEEKNERGLTPNTNDSGGRSEAKQTHGTPSVWASECVKNRTRGVSE